jgi:hypothetical protein
MCTFPSDCSNREGWSRVHHVELAEVETAVNFTSPPNWLGCCPHSCLFLGTGLESLLWRHSDERRASTPWACVGVARDYSFEGCRRFLRGLVHTVPELPIGTSGMPEGPSGTLLAKCYEIHSISWYWNSVKTLYTITSYIYHI